MRVARLTWVLVSLAPLLVAVTPSARADGPAFHELWRQGREHGWEGWTLSGVRSADGQLVLEPTPGAEWPETERAELVEPSWHAVVSGTAISPERDSGEPFFDLIPSWNADTPPGTWIEVRLRARLEDRWTGWYVLGLWSSEGSPWPRRSVAGQDDADARVLTDILALRGPGSGYQLSLTLVSADATRTPRVALAAVLASRRSASARVGASDHGAWGTTLPVPERSQMVYPGGGEVWCSPTSTSMVMAYWAGVLGRPELDRAVPEVAARTYDSVYHGHGNWPFNTAYAAQHGLTAYVSRFSSLDQVERWIEAGVPVVASLAWARGELANAPVGSTDGHLLVVVGFSSGGDVVVNDPAGDPRRGQSVRRTYRRDQFETLWLRAGGTVYLVHPDARGPGSAGAFGAW